MALIELGRYPKAERLLRILHQRDEGCSHWLRHLSFAVKRQGRTDESIAILKQAIEAEPEDGQNQKVLGVTLFELGEYQEAKLFYEEAIEVQPYNYEAMTNLGNAHSRLGQYEDALKWHEAAVVGNGTNHDFLLNLNNTRMHLARKALESRTIPQGLKLYLEAIGVRHARATDLNVMGDALFGMNRLEDRAEAYGRAISIEDDFANAYIGLGNVFRDLRQYEDAEFAYQDAVRLYRKEDSDSARMFASYATKQLEVIRRAPELEKVLAGERQATTPEEWAAAENLAYNQMRHREIVALGEETFENAPELIGTHESWHAWGVACSAALLAADPEADLSPGERARVRELARTWLTGEVERWTAWVVDGGERAEDGRTRLGSALSNGNFASVRPDALGEIPEDERAAWLELWAAIEVTLQENDQ